MGTDQKAGTRAAAATQSANAKAGWIMLGAALLLAAGSIGYNVFGGSDTAPAGSEAGTEPQSIEDLLALAEASTTDARPWRDLAFAYFQRGEFDQSAMAYERAAGIDPDDAVLWSALGEALVMASARDPLPPAALEAFTMAIARDPQDPRARYFLAVKKDLEDDHAGAIAAWLDLLADTPPGAPWENDLVRTIQQVGAINEIDVETRLAATMNGRMPAVMAPGSGSAAGLAASPNVRGPSAAEVAAAGAIPPGEQRKMAEGMVAQLEARLADQPGNLDGWVMLMRSRMTLGEPAKAKAALDAAIRTNPDEAAELRRQAQALGVR